MSELKYIAVEQKDDTFILLPMEPIGHLDGEAIRKEWDLLLAQINANDVQHAVIDFGALDYFGSTMLDLLIVLWKRLNKQGKKMALCSVSPLGLEILQVAKFDTIWPIVPGRQQAIEIVRS